MGDFMKSLMNGTFVLLDQDSPGLPDGVDFLGDSDSHGNVDDEESIDPRNFLR